MALRKILTDKDEMLHKVCKPVDKFDEKLALLLDDMHETLDKAQGLGLAAPQIGILKRLVVIDVGDGLIELINPEITSFEGSEKDIEGCLSVPGKYGYVVRPKTVTVTALDRNGEMVTYHADGMLKKAFCHEIDHLDGILYVDKVTEYVEIEE